MNNNFSLGDRLKELRNNRGMTQEYVANTAEITTAYLGQVERGQKNVTVVTLEKVCKALNVSLAEFFSTADTKTEVKEDELLNQIVYQLHGRSEPEKSAILKIVKAVLSIQNPKE